MDVEYVETEIGRETQTGGERQRERERERETAREREVDLPCNPLSGTLRL